MTTNDHEQNIAKNMSPKSVFFAGIAGGVLVICTIGFFVLLGIFMNSRGGSLAGPSAVNSPTQPAVNAPVPTSPPTSANIQLAKFTGDEWYKGGKDAKVTVVEFSDTECPFCKRFHETMNQVIAEYGDKVKWIYKHAPLASLHSKAQREAEATECAGELGGNDGFWKYTDRLFEITPSNNGLADSQLPQIAEDVGLNRSKFETCLNSGKYAAKVLGQLREAETAGLTGTPYSVVVAGEQKIPISGAQPFAQVKAVIDSLL